MSVERRSLPAMIALYKMEPSLRDLYVEGSNDRRFLEWFFSATNHPHVDVLEIGSVEIETDIVEPTGYSGEKGRVIAAAEALANAGLSTAPNVRFLCDADLDLYVEQIRLAPTILIRTCRSCMEAYFAELAIIEKLFRVWFGRSPGLKLIHDLLKTLEFAMSLRIAKARCIPNASWYPIERCLMKRDDAIVFDYELWLDRALQQRGLGMERERFKTECARAQREMEALDAIHLHGHDFIEALGWLARELGVRNDKCAPGSVLHSLMMAASANDFAEHVAFQRLLAWASLSEADQIRFI